ncbi:hypothetical protein ACFWBV_12890 [Streptomyces sp. NPDC060030]|uniref:hypothetical protein n=1 Tax=Streptomyces sp. NPDC060030 TaxID=3347042 RepID=UPI00367B7929
MLALHGLDPLTRDEFDRLEARPVEYESWLTLFGAAAVVGGWRQTGHLEPWKSEPLRVEEVYAAAERNRALITSPWHIGLPWGDEDLQLVLRWRDVNNELKNIDKQPAPWQEARVHLPFAGEDASSWSAADVAHQILDQRLTPPAAGSTATTSTAKGKGKGRGKSKAGVGKRKAEKPAGSEPGPARGKRTRTTRSDHPNPTPTPASVVGGGDASSEVQVPGPVGVTQGPVVPFGPEPVSDGESPGGGSGLFPSTSGDEMRAGTPTGPATDNTSGIPDIPALITDGFPDGLGWPHLFALDNPGFWAPIGPGPVMGADDPGDPGDSGTVPVVDGTDAVMVTEVEAEWVPLSSQHPPAHLITGSQAQHPTGQVPTNPSLGQGPTGQDLMGPLLGQGPVGLTGDWARLHPDVTRPDPASRIDESMPAADAGLPRPGTVGDGPAPDPVEWSIDDAAVRDMTEDEVRFALDAWETVTTDAQNPPDINFPMDGQGEHADPYLPDDITMAAWLQDPTNFSFNDIIGIPSPPADAGSDGADRNGVTVREAEPVPASGGPGSLPGPLSGSGTDDETSRYPDGTPAMPPEWAHKLDQARTVLETASSELLQHVGQLMGIHRSPGTIAGDTDPTTPQNRYRALHNDIAALIALSLTNQHNPDDLKEAWQLSEQLRDHFHTHPDPLYILAPHEQPHLTHLPRRSSLAAHDEPGAAAPGLAAQKGNRTLEGVGLRWSEPTPAVDLHQPVPAGPADVGIASGGSVGGVPTRGSETTSTHISREIGPEVQRSADSSLEFPAARIRGGGPDVVEGWREISSRFGLSRSAELKQIDAAMEHLSRDRDSKSRMDAVLYSIAKWQSGKTPKSSRWGVVKELQEHVARLRSEISTDLDQSRIRYMEAALEFDRRLGIYLVQRPEAVSAVRTLVVSIWETIESKEPKRLPLLGINLARTAASGGYVGRNVNVLRSVVEAGNVRELAAILFHAVSHEALVGIITPPRYADFPWIADERKFRRKPESGLVRRFDVEQLVPEVSSREFAAAGGVDERGRRYVEWKVASDGNDLPLDAPLHREGNRTGALVATGSSGGVVLILETAFRLQLITGTEFDYAEIALALTGTNLNGRHHSAHELLSSAARWGQERGHEFPYSDGWNRYRRIGPLTEAELRRNVAQGPFPDEMAYGLQAVDAFDSRGVGDPGPLLSPVDQRHPDSTPHGYRAQIYPVSVDPTIIEKGLQKTIEEGLTGNLSTKALKNALKALNKNQGENTARHTQPSKIPRTTRPSTSPSTDLPRPGSQAHTENAEGAWQRGVTGEAERLSDPTVEKSAEALVPEAAVKARGMRSGAPGEGVRAHLEDGTRIAVSPSLYRDRDRSEQHETVAQTFADSATTGIGDGSATSHGLDSHGRPSVEGHDSEVFPEVLTGDASRPSPQNDTDPIHKGLSILPAHLARLSTLAPDDLVRLNTLLRINPNGIPAHDSRLPASVLQELFNSSGPPLTGHLGNLPGEAAGENQKLHTRLSTSSASSRADSALRGWVHTIRARTHSTTPPQSWNFDAGMGTLLPTQRLLEWAPKRANQRRAAMDGGVDAADDCVPLAAEGFAVAYGRRGNRSAEVEDAAGDRVIAKKDWLGLMDILQVVPDPWPDPATLAKTLMQGPERLAVVRLARQNQHDHVILVIHGRDPDHPGQTGIWQIDFAKHPVTRRITSQTELLTLMRPASSVALLDGSGLPQRLSGTKERRIPYRAALPDPGASPAATDRPEQAPLRPLPGTYISQGNRNGASTNQSSSVLHTSDLGPCVAVCGHDGTLAFMIHSDSTARGGKGRTDLILGIRRLVSIGTGESWTISLIGGSTAGCGEYLRQHLPSATIHDLGESEGAYITETGLVAKTKRELAALLGAPSISITH